MGFSRLENSAAIKVFDVNYKVLEAKREISKKNAVFNIGDDSRIYVGGFPADLRVDSHLSRVGYNGCLDGLFVNQHAVGLWNIEVRPIETYNNVRYCVSLSVRAGPCVLSVRASACLRGCVCVSACLSVRDCS